MRTKICGQSLNGWAIFIGLFYLIQSIVGSTIIILGLVRYRDDKAKASAEGIPFDDDREVVSTLSVSLAVCLTFVLTTPFLVWGACKQKHLFLVPWLYNSTVCILINCIYLFVAILKNIYDLNKSKVVIENFAVMALMMAIGLTVQIIFHRIVYRFYKELASERLLVYLENSSTLFLVYEE